MPPAQSSHRSLVSWVAALVLSIVSLGGLAPSSALAQLPTATPEVLFPNDAFARLDTFEGLNLTKADKVYNAKQWRAAVAEYDAFVVEFPKSAAIPYALLRKARALALDGKRFEAIKQYTELLDYYPNAVIYAAPAVYYIGESHWNNGDTEKAVKAWTKMADDAEYSKHPLAAPAINQLASQLFKEKNVARAVEYWKQVAVDFRTSNPVASNQAANSVTYVYVRFKPDAAKLREFYKLVKGFDEKPAAVPEDAKDSHYWDHVRNFVRQHGTFTPEQETERNSYYRYWADQLAPLFLGWDDLHIDEFNWRLVYEADQAKWTARLDKQYADFQKTDEASYSRTIKWIRMLAANKAKVAEYYAKLNFDKMNNGQVIDMMFAAYDALKDVELARATFAKIKFDKMNDSEKTGQIYQHVMHRDEKTTVDICMMMTDKDYGKSLLMNYYHWRHLPAQGLPLAEQLVSVPAYANDATWKKAEMLHWLGKFQEAIGAYQAAFAVSNRVDPLFRIAECYVSLQKIEQAVGQLREIENFFKASSSDAALRIAHVYRDAGQKDKYIANLRGVLQKYRESSQSSNAHLELEALGIKNISGGTDAQ
ncbi:MAG: tetratricopeptide repeat protein [Planctomycetota bacterium]|nr:tetratricopeptide repeat protein [Planctomycetota bacterium]